MGELLTQLAMNIPPELVEDVGRDPRMVEVMINAAREYKRAVAEALRNPYEMTVEAQLAALHRANEGSGANPYWVRIPESDFTRLEATAPAWPKGKRAFRLLRIRFGEEDVGVASTYEAHLAHIRRVLGAIGSSVWCWEHLRSESGIALLNGNHSHRACVDWILADLGAHQDHESVLAVRDATSLADEMLVAAWMFPEMIRDIDHEKVPGYIVAGYGVNAPARGGEAWRHALVLRHCRGRQEVVLHGIDRSKRGSGLTVPRMMQSAS